MPARATPITPSPQDAPDTLDERYTRSIHLVAERRARGISVRSLLLAESGITISAGSVSRYLKRTPGYHPAHSEVALRILQLIERHCKGFAPRPPVSPNLTEKGPDGGGDALAVGGYNLLLNWNQELRRQPVSDMMAQLPALVNVSLHSDPVNRGRNLSNLLVTMTIVVQKISPGQFTRALLCDLVGWARQIDAAGQEADEDCEDGFVPARRYTAMSSVLAHLGVLTGNREMESDGFRGALTSAVGSKEHDDGSWLDLTMFLERLFEMKRPNAEERSREALKAAQAGGGASLPHMKLHLQEVCPRVFKHWKSIDQSVFNFARKEFVMKCAGVLVILAALVGVSHPSPRPSPTCGAAISAAVASVPSTDRVKDSRVQEDRVKDSRFA